MQKPVGTDWFYASWQRPIPKTTIIIHSTSILLNKPSTT